MDMDRCVFVVYKGFYEIGDDNYFIIILSYVNE